MKNLAFLLCCVILFISCNPESRMPSDSKPENNSQIENEVVEAPEDIGKIIAEVEAEFPDAQAEKNKALYDRSLYVDIELAPDSNQRLKVYHAGRTCMKIDKVYSNPPGLGLVDVDGAAWEMYDMGECMDAAMETFRKPDAVGIWVQVYWQDGIHRISPDNFEYERLHYLLNIRPVMIIDKAKGVKLAYEDFADQVVPKQMEYNLDNFAQGYQVDTVKQFLQTDLDQDGGYEETYLYHTTREHARGGEEIWHVAVFERQENGTFEVLVPQTQVGDYAVARMELKKGEAPGTLRLTALKGDWKTGKSETIAQVWKFENGKLTVAE